MMFVEATIRRKDGSEATQVRAEFESIQAFEAMVQNQYEVEGLDPAEWEVIYE